MRIASRGLVVLLSLSAVLAAGSADAANNAMKDLMKKMGAAAAGDDAKALVPLLVQTKSMKPAGDADFAGWDASADKAKAAAESGDLAAAKAACKDCHTTLRDKYKAKYGSKAP